MKEKFPLSLSEIFTVGGAISIAYTLADAFGASNSASAIIAILVFLVSIIIWSIIRLWTYEGSRFRLTDFKKGQVAYKSFEDAKRSIYVTHFTTALPEEVYIVKMLEKMDKDGVPVTRLLPSRSLAQEWLKRFHGNSRYTQFTASVNELPFDFLIVDGQSVVFALPTHQNDTEFGQAMIVNNKDLAFIFLGIFEKLHQNKRPRNSGKA